MPFDCASPRPPPMPGHRRGEAASRADQTDVPYSEANTMTRMSRIRMISSAQTIGLVFAFTWGVAATISLYRGEKIIVALVETIR